LEACCAVHPRLHLESNLSFDVPNSDVEDGQLRPDFGPSPCHEDERAQSCFAVDTNLGDLISQHLQLLPRLVELLPGN
jgi:hypothetical protein